MNTQNLTDRYVDAALRSVPEKQRADIGAELRASIADQIDARVEAGEPVQDAERAVLTELGDPDRLAAGYADRPLHLIGPRYFLDWWRLLKLLLAIVPACAAFGVALGQVLAGESFGTVVGAVVGVVLQAILQVAFWVTLVFAILERTTGRQPGGSLIPWSLDSLPEKRETGAGLSDLIGAVIWPIIIAGALLWDRFIGLARIEHEWMPFFHEGLWPWGYVFVFAILALEILVAIVVFARRRWTYGLAAVNAVLSLAIAVPALALLWQGRLVNPAVVGALSDVAGAEVFGTGGIIAIIVGFVIAGTTLWGIIDAFLKARRGR